MNVPRWAGSPFTFGVMRCRILWFRVLVGLVLAALLLASFLRSAASTEPPAPDRAVEEQAPSESVPRDHPQSEHELERARLEREKRRWLDDHPLRDLVTKKTIAYTTYGRADGEVVYADFELGFAWINLGTNHGLRRKVRFVVYQYIKGGRQRIKGVIEVRRVEEDMAKCVILQGKQLHHPITGKTSIVPNPSDPVVKGDLIRNPLFDAEEQKVLVFLGKGPENRAGAMAEIRRKVMEHGARVEERVSIQTDFVVLHGEQDEELQDEYDRAAQFGVIFMREEELRTYLGCR